MLASQISVAPQISMMIDACMCIYSYFYLNFRCTNLSVIRIGNMLARGANGWPLESPPTLFNSKYYTNFQK